MGWGTGLAGEFFGESLFLNSCEASIFFGGATGCKGFFSAAWVAWIFCSKIFLTDDMELGAYVISIFDYYFKLNNHDAAL